MISFVGPCNFNLSKCLGGNSILVTRTLFHFSLSLLIVSPFLFFIRDEIFRKWFRFALIWFGIAIVLIAISPESHAGIFAMMNPTKESVSILFASLFIPTTLLKLFLDSKKTS